MFSCPGDQQGANRQRTTHKKAPSDMSGGYMIPDMSCGSYQFCLAKSLQILNPYHPSRHTSESAELRRRKGAGGGEAGGKSPGGKEAKAKLSTRIAVVKCRVKFMCYSSSPICKCLPFASQNRVEIYKCEYYIVINVHRVRKQCPNQPGSHGAASCQTIERAFFCGADTMIITGWGTFY